MFVSALMALYRYFKPMSKSPLPDPEDSLSEVLPSATIKATNKVVLATKQPKERPSKSRKRGRYVKLTGVQQAHADSKIRLLSWESSSDSLVQ